MGPLCLVCEGTGWLFAATSGVGRAARVARVGTRREPATATHRTKKTPPGARFLSETAAACRGAAALVHLELVDARVMGLPVGADQAQYAQSVDDDLGQPGRDLRADVAANGRHGVPCRAIPGLHVEVTKLV